MIKTILYRSIAALMMMGAASFAADAQSFKVHMHDGTVVEYNCEDVDSIAFIPEELHPGTAKLFSAPANTYIVTGAGEYEFYTCRPLGSEIEGVASAGWIWATKQNESDKEQALISDVSYADGKIRFTATENKGNAVVAAFNNEGKVLWVWLIWLTNQPGEMEYESGKVFVDRFMGAVSANPNDGRATWGTILYQWGRPVPLFGGYEEEYGLANSFNEARKWTVMNPEYGFQWIVSQKQASDMEEGIANPTTFYSGSANGNWLVQKRCPDLWPGDKSDYDPSPAGYKLPRCTDWGENFMSSLRVYGNNVGATYNYKGKTAFYPCGNQNRLYDTGENVIGFPGFMAWNTEYLLDDYLGLLEKPNCPPLEQLLEMNMIDYTATRAIYQTAEGAVVSESAVSNPAFALPVRYIKDEPQTTEE